MLLALVGQNMHGGNICLEITKSGNTASCKRGDRNSSALQEHVAGTTVLHSDYRESATQALVRLRAEDTNVHTSKVECSHWRLEHRVGRVDQSPVLDHPRNVHCQS